MLSGGLSGSGLPDLELPALYDDVVLVVHPWLAPTFTTLVDPRWDAARVSKHVADEVRLVLGLGDGGRLRYEYFGSDFVQDRRMDRILVTCIPDGTLDLARQLNPSGVEVRSSLAVVAVQITQGLELAGDPESTRVSLGWYPPRAELTIVRDGSLRLAGFVEFEDTAAGVSRIETLLETVGFSERPPWGLYLYGHEIEQSSFSDSQPFSEARIEWLRPDDLFEVYDRPVSGDSRFTAVAACALSHLTSQV